jgi:hypothetical protein
MKIIAEILEKAAYTRLKERYGVLVDLIFVEEESNSYSGRSFKMKFQLFNWKMISTESGTGNEREIGVGLAEIERAIYQILKFSGGMEEEEIHLNSNLPKNGIYMHREVYMELMGSERESMKIIEEHLKRRGKR